ncbi:DUF4177 domain-containing protein [Lutibacter sp.]|uniref:DUF4177 domain-containing protein n=1 Tax=Lutibacter sp. TaxID=1925666 RepID=UPI002734A32D|nr:DUF4177 domain-containing protein [Lutibacter sp.]MDP3312221.1 DUF4177 domain-containing protein [Lutibacter sp.]
MKEYKFINQKFSWTDSQEKFEKELNTFGSQGWRVVNIYGSQTTQVTALLERDKNR